MLHVGGDLVRVSKVYNNTIIFGALNGSIRHFDAGKDLLEGVVCVDGKLSVRPSIDLERCFVSDAIEGVEKAKLKVDLLSSMANIRQKDDVYISMYTGMIFDDVEAEVVKEEGGMSLLRVTNMQDTGAWKNTYLLLLGDEVVNIGRFTGETSMRFVEDTAIEVFSATEKKRFKIYVLGNGQGFACVVSSAKLSTVITTQVQGAKEFYKSHSLETGKVSFIKTEKGAKKFSSIEEVHNTIEELAHIKPGVAFTYETI